MFNRKYLAVSLITLCWQVGVDVDLAKSKLDPVMTTATVAPGPHNYIVCPYGDGDRLDAIGATITITMRVSSGDVVPNIPPSDSWLIGCDDQVILWRGHQSINADALSDENGETTMSGALMGGGCDDGVLVVVMGEILISSDGEAVCLPINVRSPDIAGFDGARGNLVVNLVDFAVFGSAFSTYDACADFDSDGVIDLLDLSIFARHFLHTTP